jgi:hypothetical protein
LGLDQQGTVPRGCARSLEYRIDNLREQLKDYRATRYQSQ